MATTSTGRQLSGKYWVSWANTNAKNSDKLDDLEPDFRKKVEAFIQALKNAGAKVTINATRRSAKRAYLFHWCWKIGLKKAKPSEATAMPGVPIQWDHGNLEKSIEGAKEMIRGFGLAVPPKSTVAPALRSNHIAGKAIDIDIQWTGTLKVKKKDGTVVEVVSMSDPNANVKLQQVGESYGVKKLTSDKPHWSYNGR
jgi:hypothetical protein